ncbi:amidohydrolase [candidate division KSB1 bacterium]
MLKYHRVFQFLALSAVLFSVYCGGGQVFEADLALVNGKVWTVDADNPQVEAVAVWGGRILAAGTTAEIMKVIGTGTEVIDLDGKLVVPGFNDSHTHFVSGGFHLMGVQLKDARNEEEFGERLAAKSAELPPGAWITGGTWDHDNWPGGNLPTAELIDRYVPDRPVFVTRYDGHMSVANSAALRRAGVTARTSDPPGGIIVRKPGFMEPAGVLRETAQGLVRRVIPPSGREEIRLAIETALEHARSMGVTSVHQVDVTSTHLEIYQELLNDGALTSRIYGFIPIADQNELTDLGVKSNFSADNWITIGGVKGFIDGSLGSSTALFYEPYTQDPSTRGIYVVDPELLREQIIEADKAGLHVAIHAIGDKAISDLLDMFAEAIEINGPRDRRFRIEHSQHMHEKDFKRYTELGVIASVQPYHAIDDARFAERRIGHERCKLTYAFKTFLDNNVVMTLGSDWTVAPLDPLSGIYAAITRIPRDGSSPEGWFPEQKISVEKAVEGYTLTGAYASFQEDIRGSITPGKCADMAVLSRDILSIPPEEIRDTEVLYTILDGTVVFRKQE